MAAVEVLPIGGEPRLNRDPRMYNINDGCWRETALLTSIRRSRKTQTLGEKPEKGFWLTPKRSLGTEQRMGRGFVLSRYAAVSRNRGKIWQDNLQCTLGHDGQAGLQNKISVFHSIPYKQLSCQILRAA